MNELRNKLKERARIYQEQHPDAVVPGHSPDCHECHLALAREYERKRHP